MDVDGSGVAIDFEVVTSPKAALLVLIDDPTQVQSLTHTQNP